MPVERSATTGALFRYAGDRYFPTAALPLLAQRVVHQTDQTPHDHDFLEIAVVTAGRATHVTARGNAPINRGFVVVLRPGAWHAYARPRGLTVYNLLVGPELLRRELAWMLDEPAINHLLWSGPLGLDRDGVVTLRLGPAGLATCTKLLDELVRLTGRASADAPFRRPREVARLVLFLDELASHLGPAHRAVSARTRPVAPGVLRAVRLLEADVARPWSTTALAARVHLSDGYLIRLFKAATGLPPLAYLARLRAEKAAGLLIRTDAPVARVGEAVGWPSPYYFARRFKAHFGLPATEYRKRFARAGAG